MSDSRTAGWGTTGVATAAVTLVASAVVFVDPTVRELLLAALVIWVPLTVVVSSLDVDGSRLARFALVFSGSLVGLVLLAWSVVGSRPLEAALYGVASVDLAVGVQPAMAVLVGGALALAYHGVFEWDGFGGDGRTV